MSGIQGVQEVDSIQIGKLLPHKYQSKDWDYLVSPKIEKIANELISKHHNHLKDADIKYLIRRKAVKSGDKITLGRAISPGKRYKFLINCDFIIEISKKAVEELEEDKFRALIDHELHHCIKDAKGKYKTIDHNFSGFYKNIERYGFWSKDLKELKQRASQLQFEFDED